MSDVPRMVLWLRLRLLRAVSALFILSVLSFLTRDSWFAPRKPSKDSTPVGAFPWFLAYAFGCCCCCCCCCRGMAGDEETVSSDCSCSSRCWIFWTVVNCDGFPFVAPLACTSVFRMGSGLTPELATVGERRKGNER